MTITRQDKKLGVVNQLVKTFFLNPVQQCSHIYFLLTDYPFNSYTRGHDTVPLRAFAEMGILEGKEAFQEHVSISEHYCSLSTERSCFDPRIREPVLTVNPHLRGRGTI